MKGRKLSFLLCILAAVCFLGGCQAGTWNSLLPGQEQKEVRQGVVGEEKPEQPLVPAEQISQGKYGYGQLDPVGQRMYDEMLSAILNQEEKRMLSGTDTDCMKRAYDALRADYGGLFWVEGYVFTKYTRGGEMVGLEFSPEYTMTKDQRQGFQQQIDRAVEEWLSQISLGDEEYQKAKYVYEQLIQNTEYQEGAENSQNIISVFLNRRTVCQGYASAVQYLLEQLGIQSAIVSGTAQGQPHAWNLVRLDGAYYYMDATWGRSGYQNSEASQSYVDYNYMAMTTEELFKSHVPDNAFALPECTSVENNYFRREGTFVETFDPERIGGMLENYYTKRKMLTLRFADEAVYGQAMQYFIREGKISRYCPGLSRISYVEHSGWLEISFCF